MIRNRLAAIASTVAMVAAGTVIAAAPASAAPSPAPTCGTCWGPGPRSVAHLPVSLGTRVGASVAVIRL